LGANLFTGNFASQQDPASNPDYVLQPGDQISLNLWGATQENYVITVDVKGQIYLPNVGVLSVKGVRAGELNEKIKAKIGANYTEDVHMYASLLEAKPIGVFVTGQVKNPGEYSGETGDSILHYLVSAGGIDADTGSFRDIKLLRNGKVKRAYDLYDFLIRGHLPLPSLRDNDIILVGQRHDVIQLGGDIAKDMLIEFRGSSIKGSELYKYAPEAKMAQQVAVQGKRNGIPFNKVMSSDEFTNFILHRNDNVTFNEKSYADTMMIRVEGQHFGNGFLSVPKQAKLEDVLHLIEIDPRIIDSKSIHIKRASVAKVEFEMIQRQLADLERSAMLGLSSSDREAKIRVQEAELVQNFVNRAKIVKPQGVVVTHRYGKVAKGFTLEADDIIVLPEKNTSVTITGEVKASRSFAYYQGMKVEDVVRLAGGYAERGDAEEILVFRTNGIVERVDDGAKLKAGDKVMVLPALDEKIVANTSSVVEIIYRIAVAAGVLVNI
jgi:protein involved in polysaccharide export with SLBB domain